jgi:arginase
MSLSCQCSANGDFNFRWQCGDRNERSMRGAIDHGTAIGQQYGASTRTVGLAAEPVEGGWAEQLRAATPNLTLLATEIAELLAAEVNMVLTTGRCAVSIVTLPFITRRFPDAAIILFDVHGDRNQPTNYTNYLGGMDL